MRRNCDGTDPYVVDDEGMPCRCGALFDDVERMVTHPHRQILSFDHMNLSGKTPEDDSMSPEQRALTLDALRRFGERDRTVTDLIHTEGGVT